jgi:hypothetical protein
VRRAVHLVASLIAVLVPGAALAETCSVQVVGAATMWKFVRAYDADTGEVVLRQAIKAGDSKDVTVSKNRLRIEFKLAGDREYHSSRVTTCEGGNTVRI